jgi:hypothetical protein
MKNLWLIFWIIYLIGRVCHGQGAPVSVTNKSLPVSITGGGSSGPVSSYTLGLNPASSTWFGANADLVGGTTTAQTTSGYALEAVLMGFCPDFSPGKVEMLFCDDADQHALATQTHNFFNSGSNPWQTADAMSGRGNYNPSVVGDVVTCSNTVLYGAYTTGVTVASGVLKPAYSQFGGMIITSGTVTAMTYYILGGQDTSAGYPVTLATATLATPAAATTIAFPNGIGPLVDTYEIVVNNFTLGTATNYFIEITTKD